jgi:hypothetical protein
LKFTPCAYFKFVFFLIKGVYKLKITYNNWDHRVSKISKGGTVGLSTVKAAGSRHLSIYLLTSPFTLIGEPKQLSPYWCE